MPAALPQQAKAVAYTAQRTVSLVDWPLDVKPLAADEVAGQTLVTLVSPGTEVHAGFDKPRTEPSVGGYAAVFEITHVGESVTDLQPGRRVFSMGGHCARQRHRRGDVVPLPQGLAPETAVFARLMGVSWTTLCTTLARPRDRVLIAGLGLVGNLAAQIFQAAGYQVTGIDPLEARRKLATQIGIADVRADLNGGDLQGAALAVECAGHEQATIDCCRAVRKGGEVVLVGVPWKKRTENSAFELLKEVFHRYVNLRSGWEWELPAHPSDFRVGSIFGNLANALDWLAAGRVSVNGLGRLTSPADAQSAYDSLFRQEGDFLSVVFDWQKLR